MSVLRKNKIVSLPFLRQIFNFLSFILKKQAHLPCVLEKTRSLKNLKRHSFNPFGLTEHYVIFSNHVLREITRKQFKRLETIEIA